jgi:DNA-binding NarL/FixJ family response regulator
MLNNKLTPIQQHILDVLLETGSNNGELVEKLGLKKKCIEAQLTKIFKKHGVKSRSELISKYYVFERDKK